MFAHSLSRIIRLQHPSRWLWATLVSLLVSVVPGVLLAVPHPYEQDELVANKECAFKPLTPDQLPGTLERLRAALVAAKTRPHSELLQADCLMNMGRLLSAIERYEDAAVAFEQAENLRKAHTDFPDAKVAQIEYRLATNLMNAGKYSDALPVLSDSLEARRRLFGSDDIRTKMTAGALGRVFQAIGSSQQAEPLLEIGANAYRTHPEEIDLVQVPLMLGVIRADQHRSAEAEELLELAWGYYQSNQTATLAGEHSAVMLARIRFDRGDYDSALPLLYHAENNSWAAHVTDRVMAAWMLQTILTATGHRAEAHIYADQVSSLCRGADSAVEGLSRLCAQLTAARIQ